MGRSLLTDEQPPRDTPRDLKEYLARMFRLARQSDIATTVPESSHEVGAANEPPFFGTWVNFDPTKTLQESVGFYKFAGRVWLKGSAAGGASASSIFQLPVGWRPRRQVFFPIDGTSSAGGYGTSSMRATVLTNGIVQIWFSGGGNATRASLDGISFSL